MGSDSSRHPGWPARLGPLRVRAGVVALRPPRLLDAGPWSRARLHDRRYLEQWEPAAPGSWEERNGGMAWPSQWSALRSLGRRGLSLPFAITVDDEFVGQITVGNVVRGSLCSAWVGYWVGAQRAGGGVATASVALVADHAFGPGRLHRLEATVRPENAASIRVLEKSGFRQEGLFRRYLNVSGDWRDHRCYALTAEEAADGVAGRLVAAGQAEVP